MTESASVVWRGTVLREWVDFNQHLQDGYYLVIFGQAGEKVMDIIGLDAEGRRTLGHSLFTLECHINFIAEVREGEAIEVRSQVLAFDAKRMHVQLTLHCAGEAALLACSEQMWMNMDMQARRSTAFAEPIRHAVEKLYVLHQHLAPQPWIGRTIALPGLES